MENTVTKGGLQEQTGGSRIQVETLWDECSGCFSKVTSGMDFGWRRVLDKVAQGVVLQLVEKCCSIPYQYNLQPVSNSSILASTATLILSDVPQWRTVGPGACRVTEWCVPSKLAQRPKWHKGWMAQGWKEWGQSGHEAGVSWKPENEVRRTRWTGMDAECGCVKQSTARLGVQDRNVQEANCSVSCTALAMWNLETASLGQSWTMC